jgi:hypothetical protein
VIDHGEIIAYRYETTRLGVRKFTGKRAKVVDFIIMHGNDAAKGDGPRLLLKKVVY